MTATVRTTGHSAGSASISARLRTDTQQDHTAAESQPFVQALLSGGLAPVDYTAMVAAHVRVYRALETAVAAARTHPWCAELFDPRLERTDRLAADLAELCATFDIESPRPGPATSRYVERIGEIADDPVRLIGHHYIRYLGDLSGGQAIATMVAMVCCTPKLSTPSA